MSEGKPLGQKLVEITVLHPARNHASKLARYDYCTQQFQDILVIESLPNENLSPYAKIYYPEFNVGIAISDNAAKSGVLDSDL